MTPRAHPVWLSRGKVSVAGMGIALPDAPLSSEELVDRIAERFGLDRRRQALAIAARLGIVSRHVCRPFDQASEPPREGQSNAALAARAASTALADAQLTVGDIGYLIGHTTTPNQPLPANIALVADQLGYSGPHVELRQACTGFANALMIAFGLLAAPEALPVLIVGSETGSLFFDPRRASEDPGQLVNLVQMGDGAGAIVLAPSKNTGATIDAAWFGSIGLGRAPGIQAHADSPREFHHDFAAIRDSGQALFEAGICAAARHGIAADRVDSIIPHQVSGRIGALCAAHLGLPSERFFVNADRVGNTGSAAIWIALASLRSTALDPGHRSLILGAEASKYMHGGFVYTHG